MAKGTLGAEFFKGRRWGDNPLIRRVLPERAALTLSVQLHRSVSGPNQVPTGR